jgi:hypothetical protein
MVKGLHMLSWMFLQLKNESFVQGSVTKSCVYVSQCEQRPNEYLDDAIT